MVHLQYSELLTGARTPRVSQRCSSGVDFALAGLILAGGSDVGRCDATID